MKFKILENYIKHHFKASMVIVTQIKANFGTITDPDVTSSDLTWSSYMYIFLSLQCFTSIDDAKLSWTKNLVWKDLVHTVYVLGKRRAAYLHAVQMKVAPKKDIACFLEEKMLQPPQTMEVKWDFYRILDLHLHPFERPVGGATLVELKGSCFNTQVVQLQVNYGTWTWGRGCLMTEKSLLEQQCSRSEGAASLWQLIFSCAIGEDVCLSYWIFRWLQGTLLIVLSEIVLLPSCAELVVNFFSWQANKRRQLQQLRGCQ